jgi:type I restriction enzyme S subunit
MPEFRRIAASKATTMGHIQREHLRLAKCVMPPHEVIEPMTRVLAPLVDRTVHNSLEKHTLTATRDLLLPKLMSGEIRLSDAEAVLEAAQ